MSESSEVQPDYTLTRNRISKTKTLIHAIRDGRAIHIDEFNVLNAKQREAFGAKLIQLGCDPEVVASDLLSLAAESVPDSVPETKTAPEWIDPLSITDPSVIAEAEDLLSNHDNLLEQAYSDAGELGVVGEEATICNLYLAGVSRLLNKPLSIIVQGSSSSGKSFNVEVAAKLFPPEAKIVAQQMTPQSLYYLPGGSLKNRIIVAGERSRVEDDTTAEATRALREMISSGSLTKLIPTKGPDGTMVTDTIHQEGPISFWESTTLSRIFDEDLNRCVLLHTDESETQTRKILLSLAQPSRNRRTAEAIERQHTIQRLLRQYDVEVPYALGLANVFTAKPVQSRRGFTSMLSCIRASALLNQRQREVDGNSVMANEDDYAAAYRLLTKPMTEMLGGGVSDVATEYWNWLKSHYGTNRPFCVQDLLNLPDNPRRRERTYQTVNELAAVNCLKVVQIQDQRHAKTKYYLLSRSPEEAGSPLPEPTEFFSFPSISGGLSDLPENMCLT